MRIFRFEDTSSISGRTASTRILRRTCLLWLQRSIFSLPVYAGQKELPSVDALSLELPGVWPHNKPQTDSETTESLRIERESVGKHFEWRGKDYKQSKKIIKNSLPLLVRMRSPDLGSSSKETPEIVWFQEFSFGFSRTFCQKSDEIWRPKNSYPFNYPLQVLRYTPGSLKYKSRNKKQPRVSMNTRLLLFIGKF